MIDPDRIADAMEYHFKTVVAASAGKSFEETKVELPQRSVWLGYALAVIEVLQ